MRGASTEQSQSIPARRAVSRATATAPSRSGRMGRLEAPPVTFVTRMPANGASFDAMEDYSATAPALPAASRALGMGSATALPALPALPYSHPQVAPALDPDVWLIALPTHGGGLRSLEGAGRSGAIRVSRPYGHLRAIHPVSMDPLFADATDPSASSSATAHPKRGRSSGKGLGSASASTLPATRPAPSIVSAVEVETDAGVFRVERRDGVLSHSDIAWALAHMEAGEPDSVVPLPRRQLALLLTLLPTPEDPEHPELDPVWGWAHRLRGPWERGPLHARGKLGRLIAFDADQTSQGMHRACFEMLGSEDIVWAVGVPCFLTGSVYELVPLGKGLSPSRWLNWPMSKARRRAGAPERPTWEIARVVYRVGAPRWPLAGIVEPLGPLGVAG